MDEMYKYGDFSYRIVSELNDKYEKQIRAWLVEYSGEDAVIKIPETIIVEGNTIELGGIEKKAFMGNRNIKRIICPKTVIEVGNWAFSQCNRLEEIVFEAQKIKLDKGVFSDSTNIRYIGVGEKNDTSDEEGYLMGLATILPGAEYLFQDNELGGREWYEKFDMTLAFFVKEPDEEGYFNTVQCGEEDLQNDRQEYIFEKQLLKSKLCINRIKNDRFLQENSRTLFKEFILNHIKGCESDAAWQIILKDYGEDISYYRLLEQLGGISKENIDSMLEDIGEEYAEAKSYLLSYKQEHFGNEDFFAQFIL